LNIHLELAKMVCMGWRPDSPGATKEILEAYYNGYTLNGAERHLIISAVVVLNSLFLAVNIVQPNIVSVDNETKAIGSTTLVKRRGCPPGGWPKKDKPVEHD